MNVAALFYLAAPALLFLANFVMPLLGIPLAIALLALLIHAAFVRRQQPTARAPLLPEVTNNLLLAGGVISLMGFATGHYCWDWIKHWALLNSLESRPWPVELDLQGNLGYLRFYIGAYLVPAGVAHATGWNIAVCTALWYGAGLVLAFTLLCRDSDINGIRLSLLWVTPLLLCMAGADAWLDMLPRPEGSVISVTGFHHEWWANALLNHPVQYGSPLCMLIWVPHQAIPTFVAVGLLRRLKSTTDIGPCVVAVSMLALWSPYALIGSLLLLVPHLLGKSALRNALLKTQWATQAAIVFALAFAALMAWTLSHEMPTGGLCLDCAPARLANPAPYLAFLLVELAIPLLILRRRLFDEPTSIAAVLALCTLPWIGGSVPDAVMRISMPALIYLFVRCAHDIAQRTVRQRAALILLMLLVAGPTAWGEATFHFEGGSRHRTLPPSDPLSSPSYTVWATRTTYSAKEFFDICGWKWRPQYFTFTPPPTWPNTPQAARR